MQKLKVGAIVQARTSSTRLPNKILMELPYGSGITVLEQVIRRLKKSKLINTIIIATTTENEDTQIVKIAEKEGVNIYMGNRDNVLERYYNAAKTYEIDMVVRVTSDCPCIDSSIVDICISEHVRLGVDYTSNNIDRTFPYGLDVEVFSFYALEIAYQKATKWYEQEHVTPYIRDNQNKFRLHNITANESLTASDLRITIDTIEDYALLCSVYDYLYNQNNYFGLSEIINLFNQKPWLKLINKNVIQKKVFNTLEDEIKETIRLVDKQDLKRMKKLLEDMITSIGQKDED